ncbi:MAG: M28 family peptidase [Bacteroidetes bacterium]|nr:M28 family peptidase [Bacteroidota bacterium]
MGPAGVKHSRYLVPSAIWLFLLVTISSCNNASEKEDESQQTNTTPVVTVKAPSFHADSAFSFVKQQVDFGPRVPNSVGHVNCGSWLISKMKAYADTVIEQSFKVRAFDGKILNSRNIIASFHPDLGNRILLCAHWDTRPFADQDDDRENEAIDGANDGASGVGVLIEVARQLSAANPALGVDIIFFDAEDYGQPDDSDLPRMEDSYCLGSQYWAKNLHTRNYQARYGILLDMVGAQNAKFTQEGTSMQYAPEIVEKVWKIAAASGFSDYFINERTKGIIDDHFYINRLAGIKCVDVIHYEFSSPSNFWTHWHTHDDTIDKIDKNSLKAVGQTLLEVLFREVPAS